MDSAIQRYMHDTLVYYGDLPISEWQKAIGLLNLLHLKKNEYFIRQGASPDRLALIVSGIFRVFCITESGDEKTLSFRNKGQFLAAYTPFIENRETWYSIQALESSDLVYLSLEDYKKLLSGHSCWEKIAKEYIVRLFIEKEDRERSFLTENAKTRYLRFKNSFPGLEQRISQFHIASYLGISPVSLSRIRGELK
ncbi:Crp/Fnr family transcriptional regulator [bacterium]|nr:Crp/Fnr family transcriptional regulator [bacterium]